MSANIGDNTSFTYLRTSFEILFIPVPLSFSSFITFSTSAGVAGRKINDFSFLFFR